MEEKHQLRRQEHVCRRCLQGLEAIVDWREVASVWQFCEVLAAQRQRPIHLEARAFPPPLLGLSVVGRRVDYIFYAGEAPPLLREHGVLHEVAHILLGLRSIALHDRGPCEEAHALAPVGWQRMLASYERACYEDEQECEAELLATLIEHRWRAAWRNDLGPPPYASSRPDIRWLSEQFVVER